MMVKFLSLYAIREQLATMKAHIVERAKEAVERFRRTGIKALDHAVSALGIRKALESMQKRVGDSIADVKKSIEKVENLGHEIRSAGGHIKNAGRTIMGKERQEIDGGSEGRIQAAVLSPLRMEKTLLNQLNNMIIAAIGSVERLEQAAGQTKEEAASETGQERAETFEAMNGQGNLKPSVDNRKEKLSVLKDLQEKKMLATIRSMPVPDKGIKSREAAL